MTPSPVTSQQHAGGWQALDAGDCAHRGSGYNTLQTLSSEEPPVSVQSVYPQLDDALLTLDEVGTPFKRSDANADGTTDIADPIMALGYLFGGGALPCQSAADTNDDGAVNIADPIATLSWLFASGAPPPPPFGECGLDPTPDTLTCESFEACR